MNSKKKPLGRKNYGSIPHLPNSRIGPGDHKCHEGQERIATVKARDKHDEIIVQEKLDGCLPWRTKIQTDQGRIPIGKIVNQELTVLVTSYNEGMGVVEYKPIVAYHKEKNETGWLKVVARSVKHGAPTRSVICTSNHSLFTSRGYVKACDIVVGDHLYQPGLRLNSETRQVVLGGLLGDSGILQPAKYNRRGIIFSHSMAQTEYFDYKIKLLGSLAHEIKGSIGGFPGSKPNRRAISRLVPSLHELISEYCVGEEGKKSVSKAWVDELTPLGLAIWYLDDGSIKYISKQRRRARISTNGFSFEEVQLLCEMLMRRFGIDSGVFDYKGPIIVMSADGTERFFDLIYPYVPACMKYKLSEKYRERQCALEGVVLESSQALLRTEVISIDCDGVKVYDSPHSQFDLTVDGNHNYFAGDLLVHNSNVGVARIGDTIIPIGRAGYTAISSPFLQHRLFSYWAYENAERFMSVLEDGERLVGEWLAQAHGTRYDLPHEPFVAFDLMIEKERLVYDRFLSRVVNGYFVTPYLIHRGDPISVEKAMKDLGKFGYHGATDPVEGIVYRVERNKIIDRQGGRKHVVDFLVKYVRPDKKDGMYLENVSGGNPLWNWSG